MKMPIELDNHILELAQKVWVSKTSVYKLMVKLWLSIYWDLENFSYLFDITKKDDDNTTV